MGALSGGKRHEESVIPWMMPSGVYRANLKRVSIDKSDLGPEGLFKLHWDIPVGSVGECPNPLDIPSPVTELDCNRHESFEALMLILGTPAEDGNNGVIWLPETGNDESPERYIAWNGKTDDKAKFVGEVEITVESKPPNVRRGRDGKPNGYWQPEYKVIDIDPVGTEAAKSQLALSSLAARVKSATPPTAPVTTTTTVKRASPRR